MNAELAAIMEENIQNDRRLRESLNEMAWLASANLESDHEVDKMLSKLAMLLRV